MSTRTTECAVCGMSVLEGEVCRFCELDSARNAPDDPAGAAVSLDDAIEQLPSEADGARYHARQARELLKAHREEAR